MPLSLEKAVPWGRSLDEYRRMFAIGDDELSQRFLGCADGPASFNAEMSALGHSVISIDPIYHFSAAEIRQRIESTAERLLQHARKNADEFVWSDQIPDPDQLGRLRMRAMERFLADFEQGLREGRYLAAELPDLPLAGRQFDIALCSHFLFLYSEQLSEQFHIDAIRKLLSFAGEVRVFPLLDLTAKPSRHVGPVSAALQADGYAVTIETVDYEFQRGGNQMMRVSTT